MKRALLLLLLAAPALAATPTPPASKAAAPAPRSNAVLDKLAADLEKARLTPTGTKTSYQCPKHLEQLKGISMTTINDHLAAPDYQQGNAYTWSLTAPLPASDKKPAGFPEVTIYATRKGNVQRAICRYAR